jgi:hypothetical protein
MFRPVFDKVGSFGSHHQALFALVVTLSFVSFAWGFEKLLETYLFPRKPVYGYVVAVIGGLAALWLTKYFVLHVM